VASTIPPVVLAVLWQFHARIDWNIMLPGLAWRLFLLVYTLPSAVTAWGANSPRTR
jgi:hypothetical protein